MRDPSSSGEVLSQVLHFASEIFSRVAMFMIREDTAQGIAQVGLPKAGGPDERGLRGVILPHREPAWFRRALDSRGPVRAAPSGDGDQRLAVLLGNAIPDEAYVTPIERGERVVALLYADNLPGDEPIGDTSALEVVLHEAGLTLDRAVVPVAGSGENYSFRLKKSALEADGNLGFSLPSGQFQEGPLQSVLVVEDSSTMRSLIASTLEESA
jgi:hypothetical protein